VTSTAKSPATLAREIGVEEVLHFTTDKGMMGSLFVRRLLSRSRVQDDPDLAFICLPVWPVKASAWVDYVSLSIHSINLDLWERAVANLPERWWAILAFDPEILDHDGVWFATTNNIYPACRRGQGADGFAALYEDPVIGRYGVPCRRAGLPAPQPTDRAAEVLYPEAVDMDHLLRIYVRTPEDRRTIRAWGTAMDVAIPPVEVRPEAFS
jgi:ssDNA thymidine ADP-ribosyltransferase, DarT